ncbi:hypothetical protein L208DRAFT_1240565 [Tricholoma matsutake]|nr:hypothetical protein L208DRAFT_1240565 [Tricholoma matsutake 945]
MTEAKIPLPRFLKLLTGNNVPVPKAMAVAGKIYKEYNTPSKLMQLTEVKLSAAGVESKEDRRLVMTALWKAGHVPKELPRKRLENISSPSTPSTVQVVTTPTKKKRKRHDVNELLPNGPVDEAATYGSLEFNEILEEEVLQLKSTVVNRAPVMTAWATVVAERIGFRREEALSIASVYTEMNAVTKGVSIGIYQTGKERGMEAMKGGSQPYVELMGRRPLYRTQTDQWRALSNGSPVQPSTAFSYISRSFRQTTPHIIGALKLLARSFTVQELNGKAWSLYADFRPVVDQWGKRSEVKCSAILALRKKDVGPSVDLFDLQEIVKFQDQDQARTDRNETDPPPEPKRTKTLTLEEYEAALDNEFTYDNLPA